MNTIFKKSVETVGKTVLVAALVFSFSWGLVQVTRWKSAPEARVETETQQAPLILFAKDAKLHGGGKIKLETFKGEEDIGWWDHESQWISWKTTVPQAGIHKAQLFYSRPGDKKITTKLMIGKTTLTSSVSGTGGWANWSNTNLGTIKLTAGKQMECTLKVEDLPEKGAINFIRIELIPIKND